MRLQEDGANAAGGTIAEAISRSQPRWRTAARSGRTVTHHTDFDTTRCIAQGRTLAGRLRFVLIRRTEVFEELLQLPNSGALLRGQGFVGRRRKLDGPDC